MKRLQEYIYEEHIDNNVVLWQTIEVPSNGYSEEWAKTAIEEMLPELEKKIIAAIILATEKENEMAPTIKKNSLIQISILFRFS